MSADVLSTASSTFLGLYSLVLAELLEEVL